MHSSVCKNIFARFYNEVPGFSLETVWKIKMDKLNTRYLSNKQHEDVDETFIIQQITFVANNLLLKIQMT